MSTARTVKLNELEDGNIFFVTGRVDFSRIASQLAGEDLKKDNEKRRSRGAQPIDRAYTRISLTNAQGLPATALGNTKLDIFSHESPFDRKNRDANEGPFYEALNKGFYLPTLYKREADGSFTAIEPEGELAQGLRVTCMMRVYSSKGYANKGLSLDAVILEEPVRYYQGNSTVQALSNMGIKVNNPESSRRAAEPMAPAQQPYNQAPAAPYTPPPVAPPQGNPYTAQPQGYQPQPQMPYQQQPYQTPAPAAPTAQPQFAAPAGVPGYPQQSPPMTPSAPNDQPFPAQQPARQGGIVYDPSDDPNRGY